MNRRDMLAEVLTDQDVETLRHLVNEGMGVNTLRALTSDLAWLFGAGFAPMVALWLSSQYGLIAAGGYLLSGAIGTLVALWLNRELARQLRAGERDERDVSLMAHLEATTADKIAIANPKWR